MELAFLLPLLATLSTLAGGIGALRLHRQLPLLIALGSGVLVGVALFDLFPVALTTAATLDWPARIVMEWAFLGAVLSYFIRRDTCAASAWGHRDRSAGRMNASLLVLHSVFDGALISTALHISTTAGYVVGAAVIAHDLCDGLNVVVLSNGDGPAQWEDYLFLAADAAAPIFGAAVALLIFPVSLAVLTLFISFAAGSFLYTASAHLFQERYRVRQVFSVNTGLAVMGIGLIWVSTRAVRLLF